MFPLVRSVMPLSNIVPSSSDVNPEHVAFILVHIVVPLSSVLSSNVIPSSDAKFYLV